MALMRESDPRFANLERKVGVFVLFSMLVIAMVVVLIGIRQGLFTSKSQIVLYDDSARDLVAGSEVITRGFRIGKISRVRLNPDGRVEVTLSIDQNYMKWIRQDSRARLAAKAFIGDSRVEISPGSPSAPPLPAGGTILFERDPDLQEVAKKIMADVKPVLQAIRSLIEYIDNPQGDVKQSIANVNKVSAGLVETQGNLKESIAQVSVRVNALTGNLEALTASVNSEILPRIKGIVGQSEGILAGAGRATQAFDSLVREDLKGLTATVQNELVPQLREILTNADRAATGAGGSVEQINRELPALLSKVTTSLENLRLITEHLVPVSKDAGGMLRQGSELMDDSQALLRRTGELWPFRTGKKTPETTIDVDSYSIEDQPAPGRPARAGTR